LDTSRKTVVNEKSLITKEGSKSSYSGTIDKVLSAAELCMIDEILHVCNVSQDFESWMSGSGASHHMCPHINWFTSYKVVNGSSVFMGNNVSCQTVGMGNIEIRMNDNTVRTLTSVNVYTLKGSIQVSEAAIVS